MMFHVQRRLTDVLSSGVPSEDAAVLISTLKLLLIESQRHAATVAAAAARSCTSASWPPPVADAERPARLANSAEGQGTHMAETKAYWDQLVSGENMAGGIGRAAPAAVEAGGSCSLLAEVRMELFALRTEILALSAVLRGFPAAARAGEADSVLQGRKNGSKYARLDRPAARGLACAVRSGDAAAAAGRGARRYGGGSHKGIPALGKRARYLTGPSACRRRAIRQSPECTRDGEAAEAWEEAGDARRHCGEEEGGGGVESCAAPRARHAENREEAEVDYDGDVQLGGSVGVCIARCLPGYQQHGETDGVSECAGIARDGC